MSYARKIILHAPPWDSPLLEPFVEASLKDGVHLICVCGKDCERVHDVLEELIVYFVFEKDGDLKRLEDGRFPMTTWHENETLDEVRAFAGMYPVADDASATVQEVTLL